MSAFCQLEDQMRPLIAGLFILSAGIPQVGPAFAQAACSALGPGQCACSAPLASFPPGSGILSMQGAVEVTAANPGTDPSVALLGVGDSAVVLDNGSATLTFPGACSASLGPQSSLVIRAVEGCACASVVEASTAAAGNGVDPAAVVGGAVAAGALGTAIYFVATGDEEGSEE
jgi:hypothetical protein